MSYHHPMGVVRGLFDRFIRANLRVSQKLEGRLPHAQYSLQDEYERVLEQLLSTMDGPALVVDVGGGRHCHFARFRPPGSAVRIVGVDISADELALNDDVDERVVADATQALPFGEGDVKLLVARAVLEHLPDTEAFITEAGRVLEPGGYFVVLVPNRYALSSVLNRLIPDRLARVLLHALVPDSEGRLGFPAHYDRTSSNELRRLFERYDIDVVEEHLTYYQASYFGFFLPLYVICAAFESVFHRLGTTRLAATILLVGRKRPASPLA